MTAPEPRVQVTEYAVTCLPEGARELGHWTVTVKWRGKPDQWAVTWMGDCLRDDDEWVYEPSPSNREDDWLTRHRFPLDEALERAKRVAPLLTINGWTVETRLARDAERAS